MSFSDVFKSSFLDNLSSFSFLDIIIAMVFSCVIGLFIYLIYKKTYNGVMYSGSFGVTLVGMSLVTTLVILAVTSNVVLSLGMVGALSIVRFRTAIKEPVEIVYLFWAMVSGIVIGAGLIPMAVIGSIFIGVILLLFSNRKTHENPYILILRCADEAGEQASMDIISESVKKHVTKSKVINEGGIELTLEVRMVDASTGFVNRLMSASGVLNASLVSYNGEYMS